MITLADKMKIIQAHLSGQSNRRIAIEFDLNRKTVDKYVSDYKNNQAVILNETASVETLRGAAESITAAPQYKKRTSSPRKWNKEMDVFLDLILASEDEKKKQLRTSKQQLTKTQIHSLMVDEGFDIGLTTVCRKINERRYREKEAFIAQSYRFGQRFEYDFGEIHLYLKEKLTKVFMAVMTAPASGYRFALLYHHQRFDAFCDSQVRFFEHMGGCFEEGVYDNMRNVVSKFIGRSEKKLNDNLLALAAYYGFSVVTTNICAGNEKGSVENAVKVVRNAAFATHWKFNSLSEAQEHLDETLAKLNIDKPVEEEKAALSPYRPPYEIADIRPDSVVDKYSCITVDNSQYSVPDCYVGKKVLIKAYPNEIIVMDGREVVARHNRAASSKSMVLDIKHYLHTFLRKPGALANSTVLSAHTELKALFDEMYSENPREFVSILLNCADMTIKECIESLRTHKTCLSTCSSKHHDAIVEQTLTQIKRISAVGKGAA